MNIPRPPSAERSRRGFARSERARQAQFRERSETISAAARAPCDPAGKRHKHLLTVGCEEENLAPQVRGDAGAIGFFGDRAIKWHKSASSGDRKGPGPTRNLCSSQVACVNTLLPLREHGDHLLAVVRALDADATRVVPLQYETKGASFSSLIEFEWTGAKGSLEGRGSRGANATSADALIVAETMQGIRRAYLIEWKYTEEYCTPKYRGDGKSGDTRRSRYVSRQQRSQGCLDCSVPIDELLYEPFYQIARLGLLGDLMIENEEFGVTEARVVVVCPEGNEAYRATIPSPPLARRFPQARTVEETMRSVWKNPDGVRVVSPEVITTAVSQQGVAPALDSWSSYLRERYGW